MNYLLGHNQPRGMTMTPRQSRHPIMRYRIEFRLFSHFNTRATSDATIGRYANRTGINSSVSVGDFAHSSAPLLRSSSSFLSFPPPNSQGAFPSAASVMLTSPPSLDSSLGAATQTLKMEGILWMIKESIEAIRKKMKIPFMRSTVLGLARLHVIHPRLNCHSEH